MAYWYDGAALAATRSPVIALFWCLIKFTTTTTTTTTTYTRQNFAISLHNLMLLVERKKQRKTHYHIRQNQPWAIRIVPLTTKDINK